MTQVLWPLFQVFCLFLLQSGDFSDITNWPTPGELANKEVISIIHLFVHLFCVYLFFLMPIHPSLLPVIIRQSCSCISTCLDQLTPSPIHTHTHTHTHPHVYTQSLFPSSGSAVEFSGYQGIWRLFSISATCMYSETQRSSC